jgi:inorganic pyrophosphatase
MLIALIASMLLGSGSFGIMDFIAETRADAKVVIVDQDRRAAALATLKDMKIRAATMNKETNKRVKQLNKILQPYDIDKAAVEAIWAEHFEQVDQYNRDMIDYRYELKEYVTREEWQQLFGLE